MTLALTRPPATSSSGTSRRRRSATSEGRRAELGAAPVRAHRGKRRPAGDVGVARRTAPRPDTRNLDVEPRGPVAPGEHDGDGIGPGKTHGATRETVGRHRVERPGPAGRGDPPVLHRAAEVEVGAAAVEVAPSRSSSIAVAPTRESVRRRSARPSAAASGGPAMSASRSALISPAGPAAATVDGSSSANLAAHLVLGGRAGAEQGRAVEGEASAAPDPPVEPAARPAAVGAGPEVELELRVGRERRGRCRRCRRCASGRR